MNWSSCWRATPRLVEDDGENPTLVRARWRPYKAGVPNGHSMVNKSNGDALMLVVGTRAKQERGHYPDVDLAYEFDGKTSPLPAQVRRTISE